MSETEATQLSVADDPVERAVRAAVAAAPALTPEQRDRIGVLLSSSGLVER